MFIITTNDIIIIMNNDNNNVSPTRTHRSRDVWIDAIVASRQPLIMGMVTFYIHVCAFHAVPGTCERDEKPPRKSCSPLVLQLSHHTR